MKKYQACATALLTASVLLWTPAHAVTTWNFSFSATGGRSASGTFTTTDVIPTVNTSYAITGISGTYTEGGSSYPITGLTSFVAADNLFRWSGDASPINVSSFGISFSTSIGPFNLNSSSSGFNPPTFLNDGSFDSHSISSSSLSAAPSATGAPGPLPFLGTSAAFGWSRRLRKRLPLQRRTAL
jgi:hypothetical protein